MTAPEAPQTEANTQNKRLLFLPLGGSGEIGMNMNLYGYGTPNNEKWIMIDCGVMFGSPNEPGIDLIFPDPQYIVERSENLMAMIMTHAHEDHIGAVARLWPYMQVPIYATPFTARMISGKFAERGIRIDDHLRILQMKERFSVGDFSLEFVTLNHSIPEMSAVMIRTPVAKVFHTGDWKVDDDPVIGEPGDWARLAQIGAEGVDVVVSDSTNALDEGTSGSEGSLIPHIRDEVLATKGRVILTTFASNAARIKSIMMACAAADRKFVLCGRSMDKVYGVGREMGFFTGLPEPIHIRDAESVPPNKLAYICTGSQGEERAALWRIAAGRHPDIVPQAGDTVIFSSKIIPGNERAVFTIMNMLAARSVRFVTAKQANIHVSGHPARDELRQMYNVLKPRIAVPVHGETMHMQAHAKLAEECGVRATFVPRNGDMIELWPRDGVLCQRVPNGRLYADGHVIDDDERGAASERLRLAEAGVVAITLCVDGRGQTLVAPPSVVPCGIPDLSVVTDLGTERLIYDAVMQSFHDADPMVRAEPRRLVDHIRHALRNVLLRAWGKKPMIEIKIVRTGGRIPMPAPRNIPVGSPEVRQRNAGSQGGNGGNQMGGRPPRSERTAPAHQRPHQHTLVVQNDANSAAPEGSTPEQNTEEQRRRRRRRGGQRRRGGPANAAAAPEGGDGQG